jgi:hypothetical protein
MDIWPPLEALGTVAAAGIAAFATVRANSATARADSATERANTAVETLASIERGRRHDELTPRLRLICERVNYGSETLRLRVALRGPYNLDRLDKLTVTIRNDHHRRGDGPQFGGAPTPDQVKQQIWGPYRFATGSGPDNFLPDDLGRVLVYDDVLPLGEELPFILEPTRPPRWAEGMTQVDWLHQRGRIIRLELLAEHSEYGTWRLPVEIDTITIDDGGGQSVTVVVPEP